MIGSIGRAQAQARVKREPSPFPVMDLIEIVTVMLVLAAVVWAVYIVRDPMRFPIREVRVESPLIHLRPGELREAVTENLRGGFVSVDLRRLEQALEIRPWVETASVRRQWPDTLVIEFRERRPVARWGTASLLSDRAEVFAPESIEGFARLPVLHGPPGQEREVFERYVDFRDLLKTAALEVRALAMDPRRAWRLLLNAGIPVELGRGRLDERIRRLVRVYPRFLATQQERIAKIDLRYTNGISVAWDPDSPHGHDKDGKRS